MKAFKSILALVLCLSFMTVFVACGSDSEDNKETTTKAATTTTATAAQEDETTAQTTKAESAKTTAKTVAKTEDMRGLKVSTTSPLIKRTKNARGNPTDAFVKSLKGYNLKIFYPWDPYSKHGSEVKSTMLAAEKAVEDEFGVKVTLDGKFTQYNEWLTQKLTARSADSQVYMVQDGYFVSFFQKNYLADLTTAMTQSGVNLKDPWYIQGASAFFNINHKQYAWIDYQAEYVFPLCIIYNKQHLKKAGLTEPMTLAKQGKWTWDTLVKYAKKLNQGSTIGFGTVNSTLMLEVMSQQKGASLVNVKKGKSPTTNIDNQTVKECMSQLYSWAKNDSVVNIFRDAPDWKYSKTQFVKGKVSMMFGSHDTIQELAESYRDQSATFGVVQFPTPKGTKTYKSVATPQFANFIPSQYSKEAAKILFLRNELYRQNYVYAQRNFTYDWKRYFNNDAEVLTYACNMKYGRSGNSTVFSWLGLCEKGKTTTTTVVNSVLNANSNTVQSAIAKYKDSLTKSYKDNWNGFAITGNV